MRDRTRDLEQIQEREPEDGPRRAGAILVATLAVVALTFGVGMVVGRAEDAPGVQASDPLDRLTVPAPAGAGQAEAANGGVEATDLTFPEALTGEEDRPEVLAALRAAAVEEESLNGSEAGTRVPGTTVAAGTAAARLRDEAAPASEGDPRGASATGERRALEVPAGQPGDFMLQVLSYDTAEAAQKFARDLRARGHGAFVASAEVPGRGRTWRVRIGPFATLREAEAYRRAFEDTEAMNSFVVRRRDEE